MTIRKLIWDEWNIEHIWKHRVTPDEVEEVCQGRNYITKGKGGTYRIIGQTSNGRYLTIIASWKVLKRGFYIVTARDCDDGEMKLIKRK